MHEGSAKPGELCDGSGLTAAPPVVARRPKLAATKTIATPIPPHAAPHRLVSRGARVGITSRVQTRITRGATSHGTIAQAFPRDSAKPQIALRMKSAM